ncbi:hypothetical protein KP509_30G048100 [Ceratopteris richardii]|uniref:Uncharacterized protein n=1 Tax=Ceratopteris richardii TaxID=49495 RepID=A0A8T2R4A6_CERRI|nr:hypothetical protein KP509_30G048100 [Ceratopteris richardii]
MVLCIEEEEKKRMAGTEHSFCKNNGSHIRNDEGFRTQASIFVVKWVKRHPFLGLHLAYFVVCSLAGGMSLWAARKPEPLPFLDALFNAVSAVTETGLPSVAIHRFSLSDRLTLLVLMVLGAQTFTAAIPLFLRRLLGLPHIHPRPTFHQRAPPDRNCAAASHLLPLVDSTVNSDAKDVADDELLMDVEALRIMSWVTAANYLLCVLVGFVACRLCILYSPHATSVMKENQVDPALFALFAVVSAYGNCGYILLDENLVPLNRSSAMLFFLGALLLMGNTLYPPTMRLWIWFLQKTSRGGKKRVYEYILASQKRRFTHLLPKNETIWLLVCSLVINGCQVLCMSGVDWKSDALKDLGAGYKLLASLFQSIATRTGGMNVVNVATFSSPTIFLTLAAMYIPGYPIRSIRQSISNLERKFFVTQLSTILSKYGFLFVAIFLICFFERDSMRNDPVNFSFFNIIYELAR